MTSVRGEAPAVAHDVSWRGFGAHDPRAREARYQGYTRRSRYLTMRDGVRVAITTTLPAQGWRGEGLPTIVVQTRYFRGMNYRGIFRREGVEDYVETYSATRRFFVARGYAWVDVCARGSGASGGTRQSPWSADEVADGAEIVNWIVAQPWSNGRVGAVGTSYSGSAAYLLASTRHPAVKAVAPRFAPFDAFPEVAFPGGIRLAWFAKMWGATNEALDANDFSRVIQNVVDWEMRATTQWVTRQRPALRGPLIQALERARLPQRAGSLARAIIAGVQPVDEEANALDTLLRHVSEHRDNYAVEEGSKRLRYRDDAGISARDPELRMDDFSPHSGMQRVQESGAAILAQSGWFDGGYQKAAVHRFLNHAEHNPARLLIGPWEHMGNQCISPHDPATRSAFDHTLELLRFFDDQLGVAPSGIMDEPRVRYFTMGQERWKEADTWPPPEARPHRLHLAADRALSATPADTTPDVWTAHPVHGTGFASRWRALVAMSSPIHYPNRERLDPRGAIRYLSAPLPAELEVTGHPVVHLTIRADVEDLDIFAYLEDVAPDGTTHLITEGCLRAEHRRVTEAPYLSPTPYHSFLREHARPLSPGQPETLTFDLLPTSYAFAPGHRVCLTLATADVDHFEPRHSGPITLAICRDGEHGSFVELPVV